MRQSQHLIYDTRTCILSDLSEVSTKSPLVRLPLLNSCSKAVTSKECLSSHERHVRRIRDRMGIE